MSETIAPLELAASIEAGRAPAILDVRYTAEFADGRVPGAVNVPFWRVLTPASAIPASTDEALVIYCGHGPRARIFQTVLRMRGYRRTALMTGHWAAWRRAQLPVERSGP